MTSKEGALKSASKTRNERDDGQTSRVCVFTVDYSEEAMQAQRCPNPPCLLQTKALLILSVNDIKTMNWECNY